MLDNQVKLAVDNYVKEIKETEAYKNYRCQLEQVKAVPGLYEQVTEFRQRNYEIQNTVQADELFDKMEDFDREYEKFREDPVVDRFLRAEVAFCRMMQEISVLEMEQLDFDIDQFKNS